MHTSCSSLIYQCYHKATQLVNRKRLCFSIFTVSPHFPTHRILPQLPDDVKSCEQNKRIPLGHALTPIVPASVCARRRRRTALSYASDKEQLQRANSLCDRCLYACQPRNALHRDYRTNRTATIQYQRNSEAGWHSDRHDKIRFILLNLACADCVGRATLVARLRWQKTLA